MVAHAVQTAQGRRGTAGAAGALRKISHNGPLFDALAQRHAACGIGIAEEVKKFETSG
jgi:hypothetical protein